jgi:hypothetical protein
MEFHFGTQPQIIMQGEKKRKGTDSIACTVAGTVASHNFIHASKRKLQTMGFSLIQRVSLHSAKTVILYHNYIFS